MTRNEQLDAIRTACIKANPEIVEQKEIHVSPLTGKHMKYDRPVRLADVLLAIDRTRCQIRALIQSPDTLTIEKVGYGRSIIFDWNLRQDDLNEQSDECIAFLANLLNA